MYVHLLTEHVITQTFLGFCFSQLYMFLHTANRLWRLGAWREGQLHSETCIEEDARNKRREKERDSSKKKQRRQIREIRGQERVGEIRNRGEETGVVEVSNSTAAAEQHNRPVAMMSHLLKIQ